MHSSGQIFVVYPRGLRTGGPEALHQLVDMLRSLGRDAYLVAHPTTATAERVSQFSHYDAPEAASVVDSAENLVVTPEVFVDDLFSIKNAERICWWLSIDNSPTFMIRSLRQRVRSNASDPFLLQASRWVRSGRMPIDILRFKRSSIHHAVQSSYAWSFLFSRLGVVPSLLSDYTTLGDSDPSDGSVSRNNRLVAFNPTKGGDIVEDIRRAAGPDLEWRPLQKMSRNEVIRTLHESGFYLDLGYHPGKDRMPREAAMCGALTVVGRRGSGAFFSDVPIPWEHKVTPGRDEVADAVSLLKRVSAALPEEVVKQDHYRRVIGREKEQFRREVEDVFLLHRRGKDLGDYSLTPAGT